MTNYSLKIILAIKLNFAQEKLLNFQNEVIFVVFGLAGKRAPEGVETCKFL
jgi:hypothetical protein